jgi:hypothetical protein
MPPRSSAALNARASTSTDRRAVHIDYDRGVWRLWSEDGEVGGVFVSHDAARRFAEVEFQYGQGRACVDDVSSTIVKIVR